MILLRRLLTIALATALLPLPATSQLTRIGAAGAVAGRVQARSLNQAVGRVVESGKPLFLNDRVTTDAGGRLQVMLLDETVFTVGPNSDLTLDEFVYDPATSAGKVSAKVTKGVFRFVTGKIARKDPGSMKVKMPIGTIGIRGTIAGGIAGANESTVVLLGPGAGNNAGENPGSVGVANGGQEVTLDKPGFGTTMSGDQPPAPPSDMSDVAANISSQLDAAPSGQGSDSGGGSASDSSGQDTAAGGALSSSAADDAEISDDLNSQAALAAQEAAEGIADGLASWDQVRTIESGTAFFFSGEAPISCSGACINLSSPNNPQGSLQLYIDFAARSIGGGSSFTGPSGNNGSFIHMHNIYTSADTIQQTISATSFSSLTGAATLQLSDPGNLGSFTSTDGGSGSFDGSSIDLRNSGGIIAKEALVNLTFSGSNSASSAVGASGTFTAPR